MYPYTDMNKTSKKESLCQFMGAIKRVLSFFMLTGKWTEATKLISQRLLQILQSVKTFSRPRLDLSWQLLYPLSTQPLLLHFYGQQVCV